jgi:hypothetical protein
MGLLSNIIRRAAQPGNYTTQYGLPQSSVDYLNQPLPDISGIFSLPQATEITEEDITETESPVGLTEEQLRLLYPQTGGGDGPRGGGLFGNLDMDTAKQFNINGNIVTGYKNLNTGLYQDISGKNIQNLGGNTIYGGILDALSEKMGFKRSEPTYPGLLDMVSPKALIRNPGMFKSFFARQDVAKQKAIQDAVDKANRAAAEANIVRQAEARNPDVYRSAREQGFTGPGGGFSTSGREGAFESKSGRGRQDF